MWAGGWHGGLAVTVSPIMPPSQAGETSWALGSVVGDLEPKAVKGELGALDQLLDFLRGNSSASHSPLTNQPFPPSPAYLDSVWSAHWKTFTYDAFIVRTLSGAVHFGWPPLSKHRFLPFYSAGLLGY